MRELHFWQSWLSKVEILWGQTWLETFTVTTSLVCRVSVSSQPASGSCILFVSVWQFTEFTLGFSRRSPHTAALNTNIMYMFNHYNFKWGRLPPSPDHIELGKFTPRPPHIQLNNQINWAFADFVREGVGVWPRIWWGSLRESSPQPLYFHHYWD